MGEQNNWMEFTRFVPGFDFLKGLVPAGLAGAAAPSAAPSKFQQWLAPTMDEVEVQKRIDELKVVQFWLEQNGRALEATIQALEVQKMTLTTLKSMNAGAQQMAQAFTDGVKESTQRSTQAFDQSFASSESFASGVHGACVDDRADKRAREASAEKATSDAAAHAQVIQAQAVQWWGALTEQFQAIATKALEDIGQNMAAAGQRMPSVDSTEQGQSTQAKKKSARAEPAATSKKTAATRRTKNAAASKASRAVPAASQRQAVPGAPKSNRVVR
ncbi:hypothetical protein E9531_17090 [Lampropedia puyangensis]|uniref:Uncharacterized protein n=1 Tax=Lampropedia puyangensis TaxID=1330072 RepID=A0A4S8EMX7_9BURK|nr:PhaM family polyhydroxyalkanoate granule multifunctional regulatory protein [Lampropedia puyangensis]THT95458.1 hypothetical protein E9531_17090 [Lampropedia puyangensis]